MSVTCHAERPVSKVGSPGENIDHAMISRIEKGERPVMDYELIAIAKALKMKSVDLLTDDL